jgi:hypothetical protein
VADLTITEGQVLVGSGAQFETRYAAAAITAGQSLYVNASNQWALAQCDGTALEATVRGVALNGAGAGQPVQAVTAGLITLGAGAAPAVGQVYVVPRTAGGIAPYSDLLSTDRVSVIGYGKATNQLLVSIMVTGDVKP